MMTRGGAPPGPVAMIVGLEKNGLGVARALAGAGVPCVAITAAGPNPCRATRCCQFVTALPEWSEAACVEALLSEAARLEHRTPLLLTKDEAVLWVARHRGELAPYYEANLPADDVIDLLMSKRAFGERARRDGWPVATTWFIDGPDQYAQQRPGFVYPCILKPQVKNSTFRRESPAKAFRARNATELDEAYALVSRWEPEVIVQEWIPGDDDRVAFCLTYVGRGGEPRAAFAGRKLRQWPIDCGNTALAEPAPAEWRDALLALTGRIWREVGFRGLGSVEFKIHSETGQLVITEPTVGRTNHQNELAVANGLNIPLAAYRDLAGLEPPRFTLAARPVKLVDGGPELRSAIRYHRAGRLTLRQWWRQRRGRKRYMLWRFGDAGPGLAWLALAARGVASEVAAFVLPRPAHRALKVQWERLARARRAP